MESNERYMKMAIEQAKKAWPRPNPRVGAVIVKDGKVIAKGYHKKAGSHHAEIEALNQVEDARGATLYVTLEPCCHHGKTPPCTDAIINAGITHVVVGVKDSNPEVRGKGIETLEQQGIKVSYSDLPATCYDLNLFFHKAMEKQGPYVIHKAAMTLDGKSATCLGDSKWITSQKSRSRVHELRAQVDAILVGINTVLIDDPQLTCRIPGGLDPLRIILDPELKIPLSAKVLKDSNVLIVCYEEHQKQKQKILTDKGIALMVLNERNFSIKHMLDLLDHQGIKIILVEGGSITAGSFFDEGLIDYVMYFIAPKIVGGDCAITPMGGMGVELMEDAGELTNIKIEKLDGDLMVCGEILGDGL